HDQVRCAEDVASSLIKRDTTIRTRLSTTPTIPWHARSDTSLIFSSVVRRTIPRIFSSNTGDATRRLVEHRKSSPGHLVIGDGRRGGGGRRRPKIRRKED